jgi:hypothetical protein
MKQTKVGIQSKNIVVGTFNAFTVNNRMQILLKNLENTNYR